MGKANSKQPLSQDELLKIYRQYKVSNNRHVAKSKRVLALDLANDDNLSCFGCVPAKNRQKKWRQLFKKECLKLQNRYEWASMLLSELKNFPSSTDRKYQLDLTWLKISLFNEENIYQSLKKVAPEFERKSPKHQKSGSGNTSHGTFSINREEERKNDEEALEPTKYPFEIAQGGNSVANNLIQSFSNVDKKKSQDFPNYDPEMCKTGQQAKNIENNDFSEDKLIKETVPEKTDKPEVKFENYEPPRAKPNPQPLLKSKSANHVHDSPIRSRHQHSTFHVKQTIFHDILRDSCVLEEEEVLKKEEKDLLRMSFYLENKEEEISPTKIVDKNEEEIIPGLNFYRHNTFINSIKMLESNRDSDSIMEEDEKKLNELLRAITHYKVLTVEIEKHLNDPEMVLCRLKEKYVDYYINKYDEIIKEKEQFAGRADLYEKVIDAAFEDLKDFIEVFHMTIYYFYKIQYLDQRILIEKSFFKPENIHNFLSSILLDRKIYSILYLSLIQSLEDKEDSLRMALSFCKNLKPRDFDVPVKYCLDLNTLECYNKIKLETDDLDDCKRVSFESAIKCLQEIEFVRSPLHKLKVLVRTGDEILQCIEEFYKRYDLDYIKDSICADDLLPIFTYVVAKSQVKCFYSQIKIIDELASRNLKNTLSGYYFVTLQIALGLIERCFQNDVKKEKENLDLQWNSEINSENVRTSFAENMGAKLSAIKDNVGPKKSIFSMIKDL